MEKQNKKEYIIALTKKERKDTMYLFKYIGGKKWKKIRYREKTIHKMELP